MDNGRRGPDDHGMTSFTNPRNGRTFTSALRLPFVAVSSHGRSCPPIRRSTLPALLAVAPAGSRLFFDYEPGTGTFIGYAGEVSA